MLWSTVIICWQPVTVRFDQVIHQVPDLLKIKFGACMWIEHGSMIDMIALVSLRSFNREGLHVYVGLHESGEVGWQVSDMRRLNAI